MKNKLEKGKVYFGFTLLDITPIKDADGIGYLFRHEKTGFEVFLLSNDDSENFFTYSVYTPPYDDSGVFHILEHTVLTGSEKYPVKDPFMSMVRNSPNTFLNAMTGADRTEYPAASPVKKDYENIFSVYTDAVFKPLLREESFMQEGIRYVKNRGYHYEGVVFSEMQGATLDHESVVYDTSSRGLYSEESPYSKESGGKPECICDLTYEEFIKTYKKYYVPNNIKLFLYGDQDILDKLELLDKEYLSNREMGEEIKKENVGDKLSGRKRIEAQSSLEDGGKETSTIMLSFLLGDSSDPLYSITLSLLVDILLSNSSSILYHKLIKKGLGEDVSSVSGMTDSTRSLIFCVGLSGTKKEREKEVEELILNSLREIVKEGISEKAIEATLLREELKLKEIKDGRPNGYRLYFTRVDRGWTYGRDPASLLDTSFYLEEIRKSLKEDKRYFENFIEREILNNQNRLLTIVTSKKGVKEREQKIIKKKSEERKALYNPEKEKKYKEYQKQEDSIEIIIMLPRLKNSDVPSIMRKIPREEKGKLIKTVTQTNGIVYADFSFDCSDFTLDELVDIALLSRLILRTDVGSDSYITFQENLKFYTGGYSISSESATDCNGEEKDELIFSFRSLSNSFKKALELFHSLIIDSVINNPEALKRAALELKNNIEASFSYNAHYYALSYSSAHLSPALYVSECTNGITFHETLLSLLSSEESLKERAKSIENSARKLFSQNRLIFHLTVDKEHEEESEKEAELFISLFKSLGECGKTPLRIIDKKFFSNSAFYLPLGVSFTSLVTKGPLDTSPLTAPMRVLLNCLSKNKLWELLREKGGAYGAEASLDISEDIIYFVTYRDPRLDESISDIYKAVKEQRLDEDELESAFIQYKARDLKPIGPKSMGLIDLRRYIYGITDEKRKALKDAILSVKLEDIEKAKEDLLERMAKSLIVTIADKSLINSSKLEFEKKTLSF